MLKCGIIGCGRIGCEFDDKPIKNIIRTHALGYFKNNKTELVALCDIDKQKLQKYGRKYKVKNLYTDSLEMLKNEKLDCLSICTLSNTHLDIVKQAAKSGVKGIIIEKPITNSLEDAKKIIEICEKKKIKLAVNHQRRFQMSYHKIAKLVKNNKFHPIQHVNIIYAGGIANTGSHLFDLLRLLFGEVKQISGKFSKNISQNKEDPNIDLTINFRNGVQVTLNAINSKNYVLTEMDIVGNYHRLIVDLVLNNNKIFVNLLNNQNFKQLKESKNKIKFQKPSTDISFSINNLVISIIKNKNPLCTGTDGYKALECVIASLISAKTNKVISLPLKKMNHKIQSK